MNKPVVVDLCCGLGGWSKAFTAEGWDAIGFDIEKHEYSVPGETNMYPMHVKRYPGHLILKSILEINGYELRHSVNPALIVASPPCTEYSYMAMPFSRGKKIAAALRGQGEFPEGYTGSRTIAELNRLYMACFRIARESGCPIVLENVKGAQPWVGRAKANFGSYYLWGDVANVGGRVVAARPKFGESLRAARRLKRNPDGTEHGVGSWFAEVPSESGRRTYIGKGARFTSRDCGIEAVDPLVGARSNEGLKQGGNWWHDPDSITRRHSSRSSARKAASAMIAEIPFELAQHIARVFKP